MAETTIFKTVTDNIAKWAIVIVAAGATLTAGSAALESLSTLNGTVAVADDDPGNTWPVPAPTPTPTDGPGNTWPAPVAADDPGNTWPVPPTTPTPDPNTWPSA
ncbi:hypothetical protein ACBI99_07645 [Nonomuraea sp. ATR24]|uniref:hypothetical protein n=1 Tax=Nonomuraea TaxID=83681 RepID=UPI001C5D9212|nr:hypothetical protein [Nonomuraea ceibae]